MRVCAQMPHCTAASDVGVAKRNHFFMASGFGVLVKVGGFQVCSQQAGVLGSAAEYCSRNGLITKL